MTALIIGVLLLLVLLGEPLYVVIGMVTAMCLFAIGEATTLEQFTMLIEEIRELADKEVLLAIPFFVVSGSIMTAGDIANRLIDFARALFGFAPGGLAVSTVFACVFFAAISGSSPVTVIAIGSIMLPALVKEGYDEKFSTGLVTSAGSLGILIPPSIPMIVYAIVDPTGLRPKAVAGAGAAAAVALDSGVKDLFLAGVGPGMLIGLVFAIWSVIHGRKVPRLGFSAAQVLRKFVDGFWALMLPVIILGGIYTGLFTPTEAAAVSVIYALAVELFIHKQLDLKEMPHLLVESAVLMGSLLVIMALAIGFNKFLVLGEITETVVARIVQWDLSPIGFMLVVNALLLVVGCLMDILSAILILVPLLSPLAVELGFHPIHVAIVFIVNLEIGYLTPPLGLNLFVSMSLFQRPLGFVVKSVLPFTGLMLIALGIITYVPTVSLGPVNLLYGNPAYVAFPTGTDPAATPPDIKADQDKPVGDAPAPAPAPTGKVMTLDEMMKAADADEAGSPEGKAPPGAAPDRVLTLDEMMKQAEETPPDPAAAPAPPQPAPAPVLPDRVMTLEEMMKAAEPAEAP